MTFCLLQDLCYQSRDLFLPFPIQYRMALQPQREEHSTVQACDLKG